ncbi:hypothetical protein DFR50_10989 [Roseiarcus fermentans]|uniref:Uncharacterized protein n=1 Tax=Roseiarcus fermentans TaxID=1473586 RepID=A0A366FJP7_9HYPH|nr:hypothetical protein [Roseiarcus fermentans]RBP14336.1 hypothetical protein DFR50_10989 [Roseiarcus fermentans]
MPNLHPARYVVESVRCAVVSSDDRSFLLGYFIEPRREWTYLASFADEATARRAFAVFDRSVADFRRAWPLTDEAGRRAPEAAWSAV